MQDHNDDGTPHACDGQCVTPDDSDANMLRKCLGVITRNYPVSQNLDDQQRHRLVKIEAALRRRARELAIFLIYDRPSRVNERPGLAQTYFAQRCESDEQLEQIIDAFRSVGAYAELFEGEQPFLAAVANGRLQGIGRPIQIAYNGIGWGIGPGGFQAGRKALIPLITDSYGLLCANADAYACVLTRHRFHCFTVLRSLGFRVPETWHYRLLEGWVGTSPPPGTKVIVKSTFEAWSVGVTEDSIFVVDETCDNRVARIAEEIGQPVTVQRFVSGPEVYVPVLSCPEQIVTPPVQAILSKAPGDPDAVMTIHDNLDEAAVSYETFQGPPEIIAELRSSASKIVQALQLQGFSRIDFRIDEAGCPWAFDVAISPGLENGGSGFTSLANYGFDHPAFLRLVVAGSLASHKLLDG
jgi:D-alanine-D-alanine ligase